MELFQRAYAFAQDGHKNQTDKAGRPYIEHIDRVINRTRTHLLALPIGSLRREVEEEILCAAALHDVVEDEEETGKTYAMLDELGMPLGVIRRVKRLDKRFKVGSYINNIELIALERDIGVIIIKKSDNEDNSDPERIAALPESERSIANRYVKSLAVLNAAYDEFVRDRS